VASKINLDTVLAEARLERERRAKLKEAAERQRSLEELKECRFRPEINRDAPEYVKRIAEEYRRLKRYDG
jgi:hypothetical protein